MMLLMLIMLVEYILSRQVLHFSFCYQTVSCFLKHCVCAGAGASHKRGVGHSLTAEKRLQLCGQALETKLFQRLQSGFLWFELLANHCYSLRATNDRHSRNILGQRSQTWKSMSEK